MRSVRVVWGIALVGCAAWAGCADGPPPLDELSLREALGARAEVVAALPPEARRRLAARFEVARVAAETSQPLPERSDSERSDSERSDFEKSDFEKARPDKISPPNLRGTDGAHVASGNSRGGEEAQSARELLRAVDAARAAAGRDALIAAEVAAGAVAPLYARDDDDEPLPAVENATSGATADAESAALLGRAGAVVRALLRQSGARRIERVDGWPAAALAAGDTVYVDAAWLVALAALDDAPDAGAPEPATTSALAGRATPPSAHANAPNAHATALNPHATSASAHANAPSAHATAPNARSPKTTLNAPKAQNAPNVHSVQHAPATPSAPSLRASPVAFEALPDGGPATLHAEDTPASPSPDLASSPVVPVAHGDCDQSCGDTACDAAQGASACGDGCDSDGSDDNSCDSCDGSDCGGGGAGDCSGADCSGCGDLAHAARPTRRSTRFAWLLLPLFYLQRVRRRRR